MKSKNIIVSLLVWLTLLLAIVLAISLYKDSKSFEDFSKDAKSSKLLFEIKEQIIYKKSNFGNVSLEDIQEEILSNKDDEYFNDKKALLATDTIKKFVETVNSKKSHQDIQALLALAENEVKNIDILDEIEAEGYGNYLTSKTIVVAVILGFLSIFFVIKIEWDRLHNERKHYREQAKDNVADILNYSMNLMEEIDRKHVDFMYSLKEIKKACKSFDISKLVDSEKLEIKPEYSYLRKLYSIDTSELYSKFKLENVINLEFYSLSQKHNIFLTLFKNLFKALAIPFLYIAYLSYSIKNIDIKNSPYENQKSSMVFFSYMQLLGFTLGISFISLLLYAMYQFLFVLNCNIQEFFELFITYKGIVLTYLLTLNYELCPLFNNPILYIPFIFTISLIISYIFFFMNKNFKFKKEKDIAKNSNDLTNSFNKNSLEESVYFSTAFVRLLINDDTLREELCGNVDNEKVLLKLRQLYYSTLSHNFDEYLENSKEEKTHSINEEVDKIPSHIEEVILKKDFEIDDTFAKKYLDIVDSIKNFKNIMEGNVTITDTHSYGYETSNNKNLKINKKDIDESIMNKDDKDE